MGEHRPYKAKVAGSSPAAPTILIFRGGSSVGLEFRPVKPGVAGSSPVRPANLKQSVLRARAFDSQLRAIQINPWVMDCPKCRLSRN